MGLPAYMNSLLLWLRCPPLGVLIASTTNLTGQIFGVSSKESDAGLHEPLACATSAARLQKTKSKKMMRLYALSFRSGVNMTMKRTTGRRHVLRKTLLCCRGAWRGRKPQLSESFIPYYKAIKSHSLCTSLTSERIFIK